MPFKDKEYKRLYDLAWAKTSKGRAVAARSRSKFNARIAELPQAERDAYLEKRNARARQHARQYWAKNRETLRQRAKERLVKTTKIVADVIAKKKAAGCKFCPETEKVCLEFHHRDPKTKAATISSLMARGVGAKRLERELELCDVVCANCHRKHHLVERRDLPQNAPS